MGFRVSLNGQERFFEAVPFSAQVLKVIPEHGIATQNNHAWVELRGPGHEVVVKAAEMIQIGGGAIKIFAQDGHFEVVIDGGKVIHVETELGKPGV